MRPKATTISGSDMREVSVDATLGSRDRGTNCQLGFKQGHFIQPVRALGH